MNAAGVAGLLTSLGALATALGALWAAGNNARKERAEAETRRQEVEDAADAKVRQALAEARLTTRSELESLINIQRQALTDQEERHARDLAAAEARHTADIKSCHEASVKLRERVAVLEEQVRDLGGHP